MKKILVLVILVLISSGSLFSKKTDKIDKSLFSKKSEKFNIINNMNKLKISDYNKLLLEEAKKTKLDSILINEEGTLIKMEFVYNSLHLCVEEITNMFYMNNWVEASRSVHKYNDDNIKIETDEYEFNGMGSEFASKIEYIYDNNNNLSEEITYQINEETEQLEYAYRYTYEYNENNLLYHYTYYYWDAYSEDWFADDLEEYLYNDNGKITEENWYNWIDNEWEIYEKMLYTYVDGLLTEKKFMEEDYITGEWVEYDIEEYIRDNDGNIVDEYWYEYNEEIESWTPYNHTVYNYDKNNLFSECIFPLVEMEYDIFHLPLEVEDYAKDSPESEWYLSSMGSFHYSNLVPSGVDIYSKTSIDIYPNPATDYIEISSDNNINEIKIFNLAGNIFIDESVNSLKQFKIQVNNLSSGFYMINVITDSGEFNYPVIIK